MTDSTDNHNLEELEARLKRALADYQNLEKRVAAERESFIKFANSTLIGSLIGPLEILEKAAFHSGDPGVKMALAQFHQALKTEGLDEINPQKGEKYDHNLEECIDIVETTDQNNDNSIAEVASKGYRLNDGAVLKPARVKVYSLKKFAESETKLKSDETKEKKQEKPKNNN
jgi:molecular chaperone GrpE (heat shock protein)